MVMTIDEALRIIKSEQPKRPSTMYGIMKKSAFDMAIKALEQEPILDKLRAELHATAEMHDDGDYYLREEWIDEYFDKYKVENNS